MKCFADNGSKNQVFIYSSNYIPVRLVHSDGMSFRERGEAFKLLGKVTVTAGVGSVSLSSSPLRYNAMDGTDAFSSLIDTSSELSSIPDR